METRIGTLEDCGGSVVICDHCEDVFSKLDRRYHDGDECPTCRDGQAAPDVIAAANNFRGN